MASLLIGCSSSSFDLGGMGEDTGAGDTAPVGDGGPDTGSLDTGGLDTGSVADAVPPPDGSAGDAIASDGIAGDAIAVDAGCAVLPSTATDVYVSGKAVGGTGAAACPLSTIQAALALPWTGGGAIRTIHVAGGSPQVHYPEIGALVIKGDMILKGDGPAKTRILATGDCGGGTAFQCAISIQPGGRVEGFSISPATPTTSNQNGVHFAPGGGAGKMPTLVDAEVIGANSNGVLAQGPGVVGPGVRVTGNKSNGISAVASSAGTFRIASDPANPNAFDGNSFTGVSVGGSLNLVFDGGTASSNQQGIALFGTGSHKITGLTAKGNSGTGLQVGPGNSILVRSSTFTANRIGLSYVHGTTVGADTLDLGSASAPGDNQFGSVTSTSLNAKAGVVVCQSDAPSSQPAEGNRWSSCPPVQTAISGCDIGGAPYADVLFFPRSGASSALLVSTGSCAKGP